MGFILPSDPAFVRAKRLKQGLTQLDPAYRAFVSAFEGRYGFAPLAVEVDTIERPGRGASRPRLEVVLERSSQWEHFAVSCEPYAGFDGREQRGVAAMFVEAMDGVDLRRFFGMPRRTPRTYPWSEEIFVYVGDFERTAKHEVHTLVPEAECAEWAAGLGLGDQLWCIERSTGSPIVFVHTDEQLAELLDSRLADSWADSYFVMAARHDEFGYLTRDDVPIHLDSLQNFEARYESNWYYYFR